MQIGCTNTLMHSDRKHGPKFCDCTVHAKYIPVSFTAQSDLQIINFAEKLFLCRLRLTNEVVHCSSAHSSGDNS